MPLIKTEKLFTTSATNDAYAGRKREKAKF